MRSMKRMSYCLMLVVLPIVLLFSNFAFAAGTLTPLGSPNQPIQIRDHHLNVVLMSGFSKTEVTQTFFNPNGTDLEASYAFPVPKSAALSEFSIFAGEQRIDGEVLPKKQANEIYEEEKSKGNDTGVANKNAFDTFEFKVAKVPAQAETKIRFVYYQPTQIDTGVGRYLYPLEDGGTDEIAKSFWVPNSKVENSFSANFEIRLAYPIADLRIPGYEAATKTEKLGEGHMKLSLASPSATLDKDIILYYRLAENLPGRVELLTYRADQNKPGTFMLVATPGVDLQPITHGADYTFVLDVSGSMQGKLYTLAQGVKKALGEMKPEDRYRIITFSSHASELTNGWVPATRENVLNTIAQVEALKPLDSTNIYAGMELALKNLDADRVSSIILVTDGVTNTGILDPKEFRALMKQNDVRVFGFLMGNNANWPLMRVIAESSGGFYAGVSNADDIVGQIVLAKSKILHECLHDAKLSLGGIKIFDATDELRGKVYRGEQLVFLGRYETAGKASVKLNAKLSGADKVYETSFDFPELDQDHPELERIWALDRIEQIEHKMNLGDLVETEGNNAIEALGVQYQLVTDQTSMVLLNNAGFSNRGIERRNQARVLLEEQAQSRRYSQPVRSYQADQNRPMFPNFSHGIGNGGGAIDPVSAGLLGLLGLFGFSRRRTKPDA